MYNNRALASRGTFLFNMCCKYFSAVSTHENIFVDYFGFSHVEAKYYVSRFKLWKKSPEDVMDSIKCCRNLGFTDTEIIREPAVLKYKDMWIEQRFMNLEEGGFNKITPEIISQYRSIYAKPVSELKEYNHIEKSTDVAQSFVNYLEPKPDGFKVDCFNGDSEQWNNIHRRVVTEYLKWRLEAKDEEIESLLRIHKVISYKCMRYLCENISIAIDLGFTPRKILTFGYLLHGYPKYTKQILVEFPNLAGSDMRKAMRRFPKLIMISPKNIIKIYGILKKYNISDQAIRQQMNIFQFSPETIELRLNEISNSPELKVLLMNPNILSLVISHNRAKQRLTYMQKIQLKCPNIYLLGADKEYFEQYVRVGEDRNTLSDVLYFLQNIFRKNFNDFKTRWKAHPFHKQVPLHRMQETYDYLRTQKYQVKALYRTFHVLLYPVSKIMTAEKEIKNCGLYKKLKITQEQRLSLILYFIEKNNQFTGDGIREENEEKPVDTTKES